MKLVNTAKPWNQGEAEGENNGNPYSWNTPAWRVWNEGFTAAQTQTAAILLGREKRKRGIHTMKFGR